MRVSAGPQPRALKRATEARLTYEGRQAGVSSACREHMICPLFVASDLSALRALASQSVGWEAQHALSAGGPGAGHDDS